MSIYTCGDKCFNSFSLTDIFRHYITSYYSYNLNSSYIDLRVFVTGKDSRNLSLITTTTWHMRNWRPIRRLEAPSSAKFEANFAKFVSHKNCPFKHENGSISSSQIWRPATFHSLSQSTPYLSGDTRQWLGRFRKWLPSFMKLTLKSL